MSFKKNKNNEKLVFNSKINGNYDNSNQEELSKNQYDTQFNEEISEKEILHILNAIKSGDIDLPIEEQNSLKEDFNLISETMGYDMRLNDEDYIITSNNVNKNPEKVIGSVSENNDSDMITVVDVLSDLSDGVSEDVGERSGDVLSDLSDGVSEDVGELSVDEALSDLVEDYSNDVAIKVNNVSMDYKVSKDKIDTLKEFFIRTLKRNKSETKTITALKNISFEIHKGDRVGIIGFNGAGKSTLLKLLARVYDPTEGTIETKGKIAPLLELGAGFDQNYTGKANIFLNGAFLGISEDFINEKYDEIVEFSELGEAINYHVKTYSSGMRAKLGFSIATIVEPDILIIDEILSVGDIKFKRKSSDKIRSLINSGITVLLVSHSVAQIRDLCNKAIWIDEGEMKMMGDVNKVCDAYVEAANSATNEQLKNINFD